MYQKERSDFGRPVNTFAPSEVQILDEFFHEDEIFRQHIERNPIELDIQAKPEKSENMVRAHPSGTALVGTTSGAAVVPTSSRPVAR